MRRRGASTALGRWVLLAALARDGALFERAYAVTPVTLPSHATIFSGLDPPGPWAAIEAEPGHPRAAETRRLPDG